MSTKVDIIRSLLLKDMKLVSKLCKIDLKGAKTKKDICEIVEATGVYPYVSNIKLYDLIVLAGSTAIEKSIKNAGLTISVPFTEGRVDASQDETNIEGMAVLEPATDGFRNYAKTQYTIPTEELLVDKAQLLKLTAPEMTVLLGGLRVLNANYHNSQDGVLTVEKDKLTNDFFVNIL